MTNVSVAPFGPTPRGSRLASDQRRAQILHSAQELFAACPYGSVSTTEIADHAGVTRGLLHHYFGTKRGLYLEAVQGLVAHQVIPLLEEMASAGTSGTRPASWERSVDAWMDLIEANRESWLLAITAGETGRDRAMHDILNGARERTATQVIAVLGLDEDALPEVRTLVRAYGGFAEEITREWLERGRISREQARQLLAESLPLLVERVLPRVVAARSPRAV